MKYSDRETATILVALQAVVQEAIDYEADAFENDKAINGADLVGWFAQWRTRAKAVVPAAIHSDSTPQVNQAEEPLRYLIRYRHCGQEWEDTWSCACNDDCPVCGAEIEPFDFEMLT